MKNYQIQAFIRLYKYAKNYRKDMIVASIYSILNTLFDILPEIMIGLAVDVVVYKQTSLLAKLGIVDLYQQLLVLGGLTFCIWIFTAIFEYLYAIKWRNLAQALQHQLRLDAYMHIQNADMKYFENASAGNLVSILNDDINQLERFFDNGINMLIHIITSTIFVTIFFIFISPIIALFAFIPIPLILIGAYYFQYLIGPKYDKVRATAGALNNKFSTNMYGIMTIKSYAAEKFEAHSLEKQSLEYQKINTAAIRLSAAITPSIRLVIMLGFLSTLIYGGYLTLQGSLAVSAYSILIFLSQRLLWPLTYLAEVTDHFYRAMASVNRVLNLLAVPIQIKSGSHIPAREIQGDIRFEDVTFSYQVNEKPVISKLNIHIPAGKTVAFVGGSGTGKSTLVKMLLRFYDPSQGVIKLDGKDIREFNLESLRSHIGYVSQDVFLFNGTIADNIAYGSFSATPEEIERAAILAEAHEFILNLPQGYQTKIGDRGLKLSGGQKQRLSIARAILKDPYILILDEATAAVDNETEALIQQSLSNIIKDRTTIIIAHRLNTVKQVDTIYVLEEGQILEYGNHQTLVEADGTYAWLWQLQTGEL